MGLVQQPQQTYKVKCKTFGGRGLSGMEVIFITVAAITQRVICV